MAALLLTSDSRGADSESPSDIHRWLARQTNIVTWSAEVTQTRLLKSVAEPLVTQGKVWFRAPNLFRWELGSPPRTIAIREPDQLTLLYPRLRRAERYPLNDRARGAWSSSLTLLEAGFPRNAEDLENQFTLLSSTREGSRRVVELRPKAADTRRWVTRIRVTLDEENLDLLGTELSFADGSELRNTFTKAVVNPEFAPELLEVVIPNDYTVAEPGE